MRGKIFIISSIFILLFVLIIARLFYWQVIKGAELSEQANRQYKSSEVVTARRGNILAADKSYLALRTEAWLVVANPQKIDQSEKSIANKLAPFFAADPEDKQTLLDETIRLEGLMSKKDAVWVALKQKIKSETKKNIEAMEIAGITFEPEEGRYYPEASSSAQILGFVGKDEKGEDLGYFGLEGYYNLALSGKPGFLGLEKDARGAPILLNGSSQVNPVSGVDLMTSIDKRVQILTERKLVEGMEKYGAKSGSVTIMNPKNGEIIAMAALPTFDPREYWKYGDTFFKNTVVSDTFEPGSIFKVLVMSSGLDAGVVKPDTMCDICAEPLKLDKYFIKTWNNEYNANATMTDVIVHSDNVGMSFVGQKLGADKMYEYLDKFGIGKLTGIDLQGEVTPSMRKKGSWNVVDLATTSFGQGIAVTPIQMVRAVSAIANGGILTTPHVVKQIKGEGWGESTKFERSERVISTESAKQMTEMMVKAVNEGEAQWAKSTGFSVAGKTGTAQIPIAGHYDPEKTNASFIAFAPAKNPKFVMLVTLKEPQSSPWAAETAAPLWFSIANDLFPYFGINPEN